MVPGGSPQIAPVYFLLSLVLTSWHDFFEPLTQKFQSPVEPQPVLANLRWQPLWRTRCLLGFWLLKPNANQYCAPEGSQVWEFRKIYISLLSSTLTVNMNQCSKAKEIPYKTWQTSSDAIDK